MKTMNSKLKKAGIETLTIMAALLTASISINAQETRFENKMRGHNELALATSGKTELAVGKKTKVSFDLALLEECLKVEKEEELTIESWMTDEEVFHVTELEKEYQLKMEDWMINELLFATTSEEIGQEEPEPVVKPAPRPKVVGVTFPGAQFGRRAFIIIEMEDPKLEIENWMVDSKLWVHKRK
jgi:hypothetical protein